MRNKDNWRQVGHKDITRGKSPKVLFELLDLTIPKVLTMQLQDEQILIIAWMDLSSFLLCEPELVTNT